MPINLFWGVVAAAGAVLMLYGLYQESPRVKCKRFLRKREKQGAALPTGALVSAQNYWYSYEDMFIETDTDYVDDITWNDLNMDDVYTQMNTCQSSVGDAQPYITLRHAQAMQQAHN